MSSSAQPRIKITEAAKRLHVAPNTIRSWERRFDFPPHQRTEGGHRLYLAGHIELLRRLTIDQGLSASSAIEHAKAASESDHQRVNLSVGLANYDKLAADLGMEQALSIHSVETTVNDHLLPSVRKIGQAGLQSAAWAFASTWATSWLNRANNLSPEPHKGTILIGNANDTLAPAAVETAAFELFARRAGFGVVSLSVECNEDISSAAKAIDPTYVVLAGDSTGRDAVAKWRYNLSPIADVDYAFHNPFVNNGVVALPDEPYQASSMLGHKS